MGRNKAAAGGRRQQGTETPPVSRATINRRAAMARAHRAAENCPASRPSAKSAAKGDRPHNFEAAIERLRQRLGPTLATLPAKIAALITAGRRRIDFGQELWQEILGEPMPLELDEINTAAIRFGLSPDAVLKGDFTLADVTSFMRGKRLAAADHLRDCVRAAKAEAAVRPAVDPPVTSASPPGRSPTEAVGDEYDGIARRLSDNARSVLRYLLVMTAFDRASRVAQHGVADDLRLSFGAVRTACREIRRISPELLESVSGRKGGVWLTPTGKLVAERIDPRTCRQSCLSETSTKKHQTGGA
jgi:hypothetical protein